MDLEHLTKHQIVLLTLLVSFVTSIATGIVTVSLMAQAPPSISRTINQIVERTVQTVSAPVTQPAAVSSQKTPDPTAQITQIISTAQKSVIRIVAASAPDTLVARGVIVAADGTALTDRAAIAALGSADLKAILPNGDVVAATVLKDQATSTDTLVLSIAVGTTTGWTSAALADPATLSLGTAVVRIGGTGTDTVGTGIVASLPAQTGSPHQSLIEASVASATPGSIIITLAGQVAGIVTGNSASAGSDFYSIPAVPASGSAPSST